MDSSGGPDRGIRQTHFQIIQQDGGHLGKHGGGNLGDQQEMGWNTIREYWDGSSKDKWNPCGDVIKAVDKKECFTVYKIALQLVGCSAMQAEINGCVFLKK